MTSTPSWDQVGMSYSSLMQMIYHAHTANINDRSMVGDRDSELAVMIDNKEFSHGLRCQLTRLVTECIIIV